MTIKNKMLFCITFLQIVNLFPFDSTNQVTNLSLKEKINITYDLLGDTMYLIDENIGLFFGIEIGENINDIFEKYGYKLSPSDSKVSEYEYFYDFPNVHVYVSNQEVKYLVSAYRLSKITTIKGISIGDKKSKLKNVYGKPFKKRKNVKSKTGNSIYDYILNDYYKISFELENRVIVRITVY